MRCSLGDEGAIADGGCCCCLSFPLGDDSLVARGNGGSSADGLSSSHRKVWRRICRLRSTRIPWVVSSASGVELIGRG